MATSNTDALEVDLEVVLIIRRTECTKHCAGLWPVAAQSYAHLFERKSVGLTFV